MDDSQRDARALVKAFLREWSTQELTRESRPLMEEKRRALIPIVVALDEDSFPIIKEAEHAKDRTWFAKKFQELS